MPHDAESLGGAIQRIRVEGLAEPISDYVEVVRAGDFAFVSGVAPLDEHGDVVGGDVQQQARQVFTVMQRALAEVGATFENVVKVTVLLADVRERAAVNDVRREFFGRSWPASTLFGVGEMALPGMLIEVEAVAYVPR
jgi:2-iminobutanoate/2-iminopropanoate deaminase